MEEEVFNEEFLRRVFSKLNNILTEAYHKTPNHIASKTLILRALLITRSIVVFLESNKRKYVKRT